MDFKAGGWVVYGERLSLGTTFSPVWLSRIRLTFNPSSRSLPCGVALNLLKLPPPLPTFNYFPIRG